MSWQATAWAERQVTGHPSRKALLLVLANYADENGYCFPSQERIAAGAELSVDTVQRQSKKLQELELLIVKRLPKRRGQWQGFCYSLNLSKETRPPRARPQIAAWSPAQLFMADALDTVVDGAVDVPAVAVDPMPATGSAAEPHQVNVRPGQAAQLRSGRAAPSPATGPQSLRHKPSLEPSIEPSLEPSRPNIDSAAAERLRAFQGKQEPIEVVQNRIAQRIGSEGWLILGEMSDAQRSYLTTIERRGELDDATLEQAALRARASQPP